MKFKILGLLGAVMSLLCVVSIPAQAQQFAYYVLDGYGGVHAGGLAPMITPRTPYFGWDIAKAIEYVPVGVSATIYGDGYLVLDGYGGIHKGGKLSTVTIEATPYFGWNIARNLAMRLIPPRASGHTVARDMVYKDTIGYSTVAGGITIYCPDDGYVILSGSVVVQNLNATTSSLTLAFSEDEVNPIVGFRGIQDIQPYSTETLSWHQYVIATAGRHEYRFMLGLMTGASIRYEHAAITAIYVDQSGSGSSAESITEK